MKWQLLSSMALGITSGVLASMPAAAQPVRSIPKHVFVSRLNTIEPDAAPALRSVIRKAEGSVDAVQIFKHAKACAWLGRDDLAFSLTWLLAAGDISIEN